jgi:hypothetical protein
MFLHLWAFLVYPLKLLLQVVLGFATGGTRLRLLSSASPKTVFALANGNFCFARPFRGRVRSGVVGVTMFSENGPKSILSLLLGPRRSLSG